MDFTETIKWLATCGVEPNKALVKRSIGLLLEELTELADSAGEGQYLREQMNSTLELNTNLNNDFDEVGVRDGVSDLLVVLGNLVYGAKIESKVSDDYSEVIKSNWSKVCYTEKEAIDTVEAYKQGKHPDKPNQSIEAAYRYNKESNVYVVYRPKDGKLLKSINWVKPSFK